MKDGLGEVTKVLWDDHLRDYFCNPILGPENNTNKCNCAVYCMAHGKRVSLIGCSGKESGAVYLKLTQYCKPTVINKVVERERKGMTE